MPNTSAMLVELPMVRMLPPDSTNFFNCGMVLSSEIRPSVWRYSSGILFGLGEKKPPPRPLALPRRHADGTGAQVLPIGLQGGLLEPVHLCIGFQQTVNHHERIVHAMTDQVTRGIRGAGDRAGRRRQQAVDRREWAVKAIADAVEL